ncbi:MAG: hypothetical protein WC928_04275, partial [Patescibacteria group bacterium]
MVSPHLIKKRESNFTLNSSAKKLFQLVYIKKNNLEESNSGPAKIIVSTMVSKLAFFYEKIRNAVDYDDEHLLRKNAIKRIFKRQIVIEGVVKNLESKELALHLLTELIQAGYLDNNSIPENKIYEIASILEKYIILKDSVFKKEKFLFIFSQNIKNKRRNGQAEKKLLNWIISLASAEIEENLTSDKIKQEIVSDMFDILKDNIVLPRDWAHSNDLDIQIYLGIARNFLNFDKDLLNFILFKYYNKNWAKINNKEIEGLSDKIDVIYSAILYQLKHPLTKQLDKVIKPYSLYFSILRDSINDNPIKVYDLAVNNHKSFINLIKEACESKYGKIKNKLWRSGFRCIIIIFLT